MREASPITGVKVNDITCKCLGVVGEADAHELTRNTNNGVILVGRFADSFYFFNWS